MALFFPYTRLPEDCEGLRAIVEQVPPGGWGLSDEWLGQGKKSTAAAIALGTSETGQHHLSGVKFSAFADIEWINLLSLHFLTARK